MANPIRICLVNRNYPPVYGATGYHAYQLVQYLLTETDFLIEVVTSGNLLDIDNGRCRITYSSEYYNGAHSKLRLIGTTRSAYKLIKKAQKLRADFYIIMTDPPILNYWAARLLKNERWALWTMDLYPDAFIAGGLIRDSSKIVSHYKNVIQSNHPALLITLGEGQCQYLKAENYKKTTSISWPVGIREKEDTIAKEQPDWHDPSKITFGYLGNLGEAHDPEWLIQIALLLDPERHLLIISCGGKHKQHVQASLADNPCVIISEHIPSTFIPYIDIHVVILRPNWTHICVPSKAISAVQHGGAVLFCGNEESDTWSYVKEVGWQLSTIEELEKWIDQVEARLLALDRSKLTSKQNELMEQRNQGYRELINFIQQL